MKAFNEWFAELKSDERWYEHTVMSVGKGKNFKQAAESVYGELLADARIQHRDMGENRKHVANKLGKMKFEVFAPSLQQVVKEEPKEEIVHEPVTGEARQEWLKKYLAAHLACEETKRVAPLTAKERIENQGWRPKPETIREPNEHEKKKAAEEHLKVALAARTKMFRDKYPQGTPKELQQYLKKWKHIDNPNGI